MMTLGVGSVLLIIWRFFELPQPADMLVVHAAMGAIAIGCGQAIARYTPPTKEGRFALVLIGLVFLTLSKLFNLDLLILEEAAPGLALIFFAGAFLVGQSRYALATVAVGAFALSLARAADPFGNADIWRWLLVGIAGMLPLGMWVSTILGLLLTAAGTWLAYQHSFLWLFDSIELAGLTLMFGLALIIQLLKWQPLEAIGMHAFTLYLASAVAARLFGEASVDFGWTMYAPVTDAPYVAGPVTFSYAYAWPNIWVGVAFLAVCGFCAWRRTWGPLEKLGIWLFQKL